MEVMEASETATKSKAQSRAVSEGGRTRAQQVLESLWGAWAVSGAPQLKRACRDQCRCWGKTSSPVVKAGDRMLAALSSTGTPGHGHWFCLCTSLLLDLGRVLTQGAHITRGYPWVNAMPVCTQAATLSDSVTQEEQMTLLTSVDAAKQIIEHINP